MPFVPLRVRLVAKATIIGIIPICKAINANKIHVRKLVPDNIFDQCKTSLEKVAKGNVLEIINFTPLLFQFMTLDLPDDAQGLTKTLGIRAAAILAFTKHVCENEKNEKQTTEMSLPNTYIYILLFLTGYLSSIYEFTTVCAVVFIKLVLNTDKMIEYKQKMIDHKTFMYVACVAAHYESSVMFNFCQLVCCIFIYESNIV